MKMDEKREHAPRHLPVVLHLRSSGGVLGAENVLLEIAKHSNLYGYQPVVGVLTDSGDPSPELLSVALDNGLRAVEFICHPPMDLSCARSIRAFVSVNRVSLLHCHGYKEDFYGLLSQSGVPKLATNHLWKTHSLMLRLYRIMDIFLLRRFDLVTGVSDEIVEEMKRLGITRSVKVQNGVDLDRFGVVSGVQGGDERLGTHSRGVVFGMVSSLTSEKNHALAIDALAGLEDQNAQLLVVGDGPLLGALQDRAVRSGVGERVHFMGRQRNIREILSVVDVFLLSSLKEGLPMALLEAMACGKAAIVSRVGENAHVIEDNINGILVDSGDLFSFVKAMQLLIHRKDLIEKFGREARKTVEKKFSSLRMTWDYCQLYDQLLARGTA